MDFNDLIFRAEHCNTHLRNIVHYGTVDTELCLIELDSSSAPLWEPKNS